jgi:hypothetical protein
MAYISPYLPGSRFDLYEETRAFLGGEKVRTRTRLSDPTFLPRSVAQNQRPHAP